ncbi:hypothetical protein BCR41DRAFT_375462 [Lobosporangium transversale]|uniref:Uncharacterized protein n=1 Tax=Lobosporangium transversale TaxID=64571 RepID=A0A1Y2G6Y7_9FUNG|nr:hypothetical protein BCR41DRAFT_375462 [Lobosporangium transversale]ORY99493.1 hypothetical protein BCR41DRAFT_375462 [Lobosporangium transversale]|eukprot:XP_021875819.1 hypothetical protein BCR41DRAFT_375462 [Lobosporangium transversale]
MDRSTGKTFNSAFIELALTPREAGIAAQARNLKVLKGRVVMVELSNQDELMSSLFPKWRGQFQHGEPIVPGEHLRAQGEPLDVAKSTIGDTAENAVSSSTSIAKAAPRMVDTPPFVAREEISSLLTICRNYKIHFSRKCAERPFENIISILAKYPWHQAHRVLPLQRDHIFELLKLSIESLRVHLSKEYNTIHPTLLIRLVRSAIYTPAFTEKQKAMVLCTAGCPCPEDIVGWMAAPTSNDASKAVEASLPPLQSQAFEPDGQERACQSSAINKGDQNNHLAEAFANCDEEVIENFAVGDPFETGIMHIRDHHALSADSQSSTMSRASPPSTLSTAQIQKDSPNSRVLCIQDFFSCGVGSKGGKTSNPASGVVAAPMVKEAAIDEYSAKASSSPVMTRCTKSLSSSSSSSILSHISLPTGIPLSMSPPTPNKVATSFSIPRTVVGSEKVKSGTILDAIKTITQSTPRLHRQTYCGTDMI